MKKISLGLDPKEVLSMTQELINEKKIQEQKDLEDDVLSFPSNFRKAVLDAASEGKNTAKILCQCRRYDPKYNLLVKNEILKKYNFDGYKLHDAEDAYIKVEWTSNGVEIEPQ